MDGYKEALGNAIRERRKALRMTQRELAAATGMDTVGTVSRWERGLTEPLDVAGIAAALRTTPTDLLTKAGWDPTRNGASVMPAPTAMARLMAILEAQSERLERLERNQIEFLDRVVQIQHKLRLISDEDFVTLVRRGMGLPDVSVPTSEDRAPKPAAAQPRRGRRRGSSSSA